MRRMDVHVIRYLDCFDIQHFKLTSIRDGISIGKLRDFIYLRRGRTAHKVFTIDKDGKKVERDDSYILHKEQFAYHHDRTDEQLCKEIRKEREECSRNKKSCWEDDEEEFCGFYSTGGHIQPDSKVQIEYYDFSTRCQGLR